MTSCTLLPYEKLYASFQELSNRFSDFINLRVIGCSHDKRYIPLLEIGVGKPAFYCVTGLESRDYRISSLLPEVLLLYCRAYEGRWEIGHFYPVRRLLTQSRLLLIPLLNPDGYEVCRCGYRALRNPGYRQMLRTEVWSPESYDGNARGNRVNKLFPETPDDSRQKLLLENENRAVTALLQEIPGTGLLRISAQERAEQTEITCYKRKQRSFFHLDNRHFMSGLCSAAGREPHLFPLFAGQSGEKGSLESYYAVTWKKPSMQVRVSSKKGLQPEVIARYPMECLFSLLS